MGSNCCVPSKNNITSDPRDDSSRNSTADPNCTNGKKN